VRSLKIESTLGRKRLRPAGHAGEDIIQVLDRGGSLDYHIAGEPPKTYNIDEALLDAAE
jgi:hypothetical protein